jgi:hypothetical protein
MFQTKTRNVLVLLGTLTVATVSAASERAKESTTPAPAQQQTVTRENPSSQAASAPAMKLTGGAPSLDDLVARFLDALQKKDKDAIHRLRITQDEYLDIIMPGSVDAGKPLRQYDHRDQASMYFWSILDTKSVYTEANLIAEFGGAPLKLKSVKYRKGVKEYATYKAYKQLSLVLEHGDGSDDELRIGSVAEIDGQYKFISYVRD